MIEPFGTFVVADVASKALDRTALTDTVNQPEETLERGRNRAKNPKGFRTPHHQLRTSQFVETPLSTETSVFQCGREFASSTWIRGILALSLRYDVPPSTRRGAP
jgi:hypothetical protein